MESTALGKTLVIAGVVLVLVGALVLAARKVPWLGKLPGDIRIEGERTSFYFPLATCIVLSVLLTIVLNVLGRLRR